jgi:zinc and cadmium transporter
MLLVLVAYLALIVLASLGGGWLTSRMRLTHTRMQLVMSFVAGLMLGVCFLHMVPHSFHATGSIDRSMIWLVIGLLTTFFLIRAFQFHQHVSAEGEDAHAHAQAAPEQLVSLGHDEHAHAHDGHEGHVCEHGHPADLAHGRPHELSWVGVFVGLALHSALDGVAVAAAVSADARGQPDAGGGWFLFGLGAFLGVLLHKPLDALSVTSLMAAGGWPPGERRLVNLAFALMCPLGAAAFYLGIGLADVNHDMAVGCALAFSGGVFVCIALGDLLPELQFHAHDRVKLSLALLFGVAVAMSVWLLEPPHAHGGVGRMMATPASGVVATP